ncbi:alpha/beta hydrolase [Pontibacter sp. G13]|uniref:alpha/beta hydrolase n=1 Tax=Pontibacter sp. G13 TaxID=3074898 RepID=UPI00288BE288|nr:alpha/beta hydrolase [Pontibacter sp. G13]WNJ17919.1 alpha/beta hydrolase [Pontibacter sp. G13]
MKFQPKRWVAYLWMLILPFMGWAQTQPEVKTYSLAETPNVPYYPEDSELASNLTQVNFLIPEGVDNPPVFLWIGGGAWAYVNRHQEMALCRKIAERGIAVVSIGHRLSPALIWEPKRETGIKHPEHVKDVAKAFKFVKDHAADYGYNPDQMFIGGFSSGAHLSTLLAMDKRYLEAEGLSQDDIRGIIPVGGGYDIPHYRVELIKEDPSYETNHINPVFGDTHEEHVDASPVTYIDDFKVPMLMVSENSTYVYSVVFEQLLREIGYTNFQVLNAHDQDHGSLWRHLSNAENSMYREYILDFIRVQCETKPATE